MSNKRKKKVVKSGILRKKSPTGLPGFRKWQERYFELDGTRLRYFKNKGDKEPAGTIMLAQIVDTEYLPDKRAGGRFDIRVKSLRVYAMHGTTPNDAKAWVVAIKKAKDALNVVVEDVDTRDEIENRLTRLQTCFFIAKFGDDAIRIRSSKPTNKHEKRLRRAMKDNFPDDACVLRFILTDIMRPPDGQFRFPLYDEDEEELDPAEKDEKEDGIREIEETCPVDSCGLAVVPSLHVCEDHSGSPDLDLYAENWRVVEMLQTKECLRHILNVFSSDDHTAHGLAIRVMWCIFRGTNSFARAHEQFASYLAIYCSGLKFNTETKNAILALLLTEPKDVPVNLEERDIVFYMPVHQWYTWKALFMCLKESPFAIRKQAMQEVNTVLHDNFENCATLRLDPKWQYHIYNLFVDLPKADKGQDPVKSCFAYSINALTIVHFHYYLKSAEFEDLVQSSLYMLHQFASSTSEGQEVAGTVLGALVSKLTSQARLFGAVDRSGLEWTNLTKLMSVLKRFIFRTAYWQTHIAGDGYDDEADFGGGMGEQEDFSCQTILSKSRPGKHEQSFYDQPIITDYGLHWSTDEDGKAIDNRLIKKIMALLKKLNVHDAKEREMMGDVDGSAEMRFFRAWGKEYTFWEQSAKLTGIMRRTDIGAGSAISYRRFSHMVSNYLESNRRGREGIIEEIRQLLKGGEGGGHDDN